MKEVQKDPQQITKWKKWQCVWVCVSESVNVSVCVREREGQKRHTDLNAKRGSLGAVGMEGISEADPCLVRPEAYTTRISLREKRHKSVNAN